MLNRDSPKNQNSERVDQIINELNSKLLALSSQDCDIEVDIRIKFPNASGNQTKNRRPQTSETSSRRSFQTSDGSSRRESQNSNRRCEKKSRHRHHHHHHRYHRQNKVDDFAFDVGDYTRVDRDDKDALVSLGPAPTKVVKRKSPDVVTLGGMCNVDNNYTSANASIKTKNKYTNSSSATNSNYSSLSSTNVFPKADVR